LSSKKKPSAGLKKPLPRFRKEVENIFYSLVCVLTNKVVHKNSLCRHKLWREKLQIFYKFMTIFFAFILLLKLLLFSFFFLFNLVDAIRRNSSSWAFQHLFFGVVWLFFLLLSYPEMKILAMRVPTYNKLPLLILLVSIVPSFFGDLITIAFACSQFICIGLVIWEGWLFFKMR
jgi:hypothetical protein